MLLAAAAAAYLGGTFLARRLVDGSAPAVLVTAALVSAATVVPLGSFQPGVGYSACLLSTLAVVCASRTIAGSAYGLDLAPTRRLEMMSIRTACLQYGYLVGAALGGAALATTGYAGLGIALGGLFVLAALAAMRSAAFPATWPPRRV